METKGLTLGLRGLRGLWGLLGLGRLLLHLEESLLLSNLRLSGPHGVLRQGHRGEVGMCGSQHSVDSSTHQRALL